MPNISNVTMGAATVSVSRLLSPAPSLVVGPILIGTALNLVSFGAILAIYAGHLPIRFHEGAPSRIFLLSLVLISGAQSVSLLDAAWYFLVLCWAQPGSLYGTDSNKVPSSMGLVYIFTALVAFLAQCFYIHCIYKLSQSVIVVFQITILSLTAFGSGLAAGIIETTRLGSHGLMVPNPHKGLESNVLTWIYRGATCLTDMSIAISSFYCLYTRKSAIARSTSLRLIVQLFIESGFALAATNTALVVTAACTPGTNVWMVVALPLGNIYTVCVLTTVTARRGIQEGEKEQAEKQSSEMGQSNSPDIQTKLTSKHATRRAAMVQLELISIDKTPDFLKEDAFMAARRIPQQMEAAQGKEFQDTSNETNCSSSSAETEGYARHPARAASSLSISKGDGRHKPGSTVVVITTETTLDSCPERKRSNHRAEASQSLQGSLKVQGSTSSSISSLMRRHQSPSRKLRFKQSHSSSDIVADASSRCMASSEASFYCRGASLDPVGVQAREREETGEELHLDVGILSYWGSKSESRTCTPTPTSFSGSGMHMGMSSLHLCQSSEVDCHETVPRLGRTSTLSYEVPPGHRPLQSVHRGGGGMEALPLSAHSAAGRALHPGFR